VPSGAGGLYARTWLCTGTRVANSIARLSDATVSEPTHRCVTGGALRRVTTTSNACSYSLIESGMASGRMGGSSPPMMLHNAALGPRPK
jgi:hypothetical protein